MKIALVTLATASPPPIGPTALTSGVPATFSLDPVAGSTAFLNAWHIAVPAGATQLQVRLTATTANVDLDLYVRFGQDVDVVQKRVVADYLSEGPTGDETITIASASLPPLRAGTYYIAIGLFTTGKTVQGSVTATISTTPATLPPRIEASTTTLTFASPVGTNPPSQTFTVRNGGSGSLSFQVSTSQTWLKVSPDRAISTGQAVTITVSVNTAGLNSGTYSGEIRISQSVVAASPPGQSQAGPVAIAVRLEVGPPAPQIPAGGAVNAASSARNAAPELIVSLYGTNLAATLAVAQNTPLPTALGGATVKVTDSARTDRLAPLFFVSPAQINFIIPAGTSAGTATITVTRTDGGSASATVQVEAVAPGLFTANADGKGVPAALAIRGAADGTQTPVPVFQCGAAPGSCAPVPINLGPDSDQVIVLLFGTGIRGRSSPSNVQVTIGGVNADVLFAGPQSVFAGLDQLNVRIPRSLIGRGEVDVVLTVDGKTANTVKLNIGGG